MPWLRRVCAPARWARSATILVPGVYAWAVTVAGPASVHGAPWFAQLTAAVAAIALVSGAALCHARPQMARYIGVVGFVALSAGSWVLLSRSSLLGPVDPLRGVLGGLGWLLYAFGWGALRPFGAVPEDDPRVLSGPTLPSRAEPSRVALVRYGAACVGAFVIVVLAWHVERSPQAMFAHAAALGCSIWLVSAGSAQPVDRPHAEPPVSASMRLDQALRPLAALALVLSLGLVLMLLL